MQKAMCKIAIEHSCQAVAAFEGWKAERSDARIFDHLPRRFTMTRSVSRLLVLGVTILIANAANAVLINYGTAEGVSIRDCIAGVTACDDVSPLIAVNYGGFPGAPSSSASVALPGYGTAEGTVALSGAIGAPILSASATSELGERTNTNSLALQSYTYIGTDPATRTFGGTLTYSQTLTGTFGGDVGTGPNAGIDVFTLSTSSVDVGNTAESNFFALFDYSDFPGYSTLGFVNYTDPNSTTSGAATFGVTVTLNPGDTIWVFTLLQTPAPNGSIVDASHTFITGWDNTADLIPAIVSVVPEPATLALLGIGLAGTGFAKRRRPDRSPRAAKVKRATRVAAGSGVRFSAVGRGSAAGAVSIGLTGGVCSSATTGATGSRSARAPTPLPQSISLAVGRPTRPSS